MSTKQIKPRAKNRILPRAHKSETLKQSLEAINRRYAGTLARLAK